MDAIRVAKVDNVIVNYPVPITTSDPSPSTRRRTGTLHLTPHHLIFSPAPTSPPHSQTDGELWIPYPIIALCTRLSRIPPSRLYPLSIRTRTFETYLFLFEDEREGGAEDVWQSVKDCAVASSVEQLYAFFYTLPSVSPSVANSTKLAKISFQPSENVLSSSSSTPLSLSPEKSPPAPIRQSTSLSANGWSAFNPRTEFARQGLGSRTKAWRFTDINRDYSFCSTYPAKMVVPSRISDSVLSYSVKYRSKGRIPALTYLHWANHASITRCSQPMVGLKNSRSAQDERLVECIFASHLSPETAYAPTSTAMSPPITTQTLPNIYGATSTNLIIDARPTANAMANVAKGAGTENMENYKSSKKAYLGIDNIHVMRNSLNTVVAALPDVEAGPSATVDRALLRKSNWLKHISSLLDGTLVIVKNIHINSSHVLIHCSDGWDRTSQLSATAQICLDPYYRTFEGLKVLIEKDWLAFGHKFLDRSGHLSSEKLFTVTASRDNGEEDSDDDFGAAGAQKAAQAFLASFQKQFTSSSHLKEISPVFHQFLDCLYQILRQFPERFEFNEDYLIDLHYHLYSCQFGTFLFNCEYDRRKSGTNGKSYIDRTVSAWDYLESPDQRVKYLNPSYDPSLDDRNSRLPGADLGVLMLDPKNVKFWFKLFKRSDDEMNGPAMAFQAQGAEFLGPIGAGQVDPINSEGILEGLATKVQGPRGTVGSGDSNGPLTVPYKARSKNPSPGPSTSSSAPDLNTHSRSVPGPKDSFRPFASTTSAFSLHPQNGISNPLFSSSTSTPLPRLNRGPVPQHSASTSASGGNSWNWSQISSGALTALQGAASQIKTISQDAIEKITEVVPVATEREGEMWTRNGGGRDYEPGTGIGEGRIMPGAGATRSGIRIPSENNPWSTGSGGSDKPLPIPSLRDPSIIIPAQDRPKPAARQPSWTSNPWTVESPLSGTLGGINPQNSLPDGIEEVGRPSLASLSLLDERRSNDNVTKTTRGFGNNDIRGSRPAETISADKEMIDAALGGDQKAWDPLGAL